MTRRPAEWLIAQRELPGRKRLSERRLYRRRERTFAILAAVFLVGTALAPIVGASRVFGAARPLRELGLVPPMQLLLPVGAVGLPFALLALHLACELFGKRRAWTMVWLGLATALPLLGLAWITDVVPDYDGTVTRALGPDLAFAVACFVTGALAIELFDRLGRATRGRHLWMRNALAAAIGLAVGWIAFAMIVGFVPRAALPAIPELAPADQVRSVAIAAGGYTLVGVLAGTLVLYALATPLATALRIERYIAEDVLDDDAREPRHGEPAFAASRARSARPAAQIVEDEDLRTSRPGRSGASNSRPFTRDEVAFFDAGDELASGGDPADSQGGRPRRA